MADGSWYDADIDHVIISEEQIREKTAELAKQVAADHADVEDGLLLVCVLKGAVMFMADFARALGRQGPPAELEFMAVSSYGQGTTSSGVVRILKDLDRDIAGRHVVVVEDIVDSGLTLSWLMKYLESRSAGERRGGRAVPQAGRGQGAGAGASTSASTSRTSSWSATGWTSPSATASCRTSACSSPRCTPVAEPLQPTLGGLAGVLSRTADCTDSRAEALAWQSSAVTVECGRTVTAEGRSRCAVPDAGAPSRSPTRCTVE